MSMKYLLNYIDALPSSQASHIPGINGSTRNERHATPQARPKPEELKLLLTEAKEGLVRALVPVIAESKATKSDRAGNQQEIKNTTSEFFDTLERITNELRGMTEHSTAFLSRVRKSDAPDYFNIVKHPMDLGTVLKKVKAQQYKDKRAFKADLDLIWDNCMLYNTLASHPLRKSATILRNRANHLLEFVTDPSAAPAPVLHRPLNTSRLHHNRSRLDALDASHVIDSTANTYSRSSRLNSEDVHSAISGSQDLGDQSYLGDQTDAAFSEIAADAESEFDDDFQDIEDEEEDESIRTRKGLVSLKAQPGGGRNLDLLRGLAAGEPAAGPTEDLLSLSPAGMDLDLGQERDRSASPASVRLGTPSPAPAIPAIPDVPGTVPGQGAALVARRATAAGHTIRRPKARTPSLPPQPTSIPFPDRPALIRTADSMAKFAQFSESLAPTAQHGQTAQEAYNMAITSSSITAEVEASSLILPLLPFSPSSETKTVDSPVSPVGRSTPLARSTSTSTVQTIDAPELLWWQGVSSDALLKNGVPGLPFIASPVASSSKMPIEAIQGVESAGEHKLGKTKAAVAMKRDIEHLKKVKRLHRKMASLKGKDKDFSEEPDFSESDEDVNSTEETKNADLAKPEVGERSRQRRKKRRMHRNLILDPHPGVLASASLSTRANQQIMSVFCGTMLQHTGFDDVHRTALDAVTNLVTAYLTNLGKTIGFYRDRFSRRLSFGSILRRSLAENAVTGGDEVGPIVELATYIEKDLPANSQRTASLAERLEGAYLKELEEGADSKPRYEIGEIALGASMLDSAAGDDLDAALLRMLIQAEHDHLSLLRLDIPKEGVNFDATTLYSSFLRLAYPSSQPSEGDAIPPFSPPPRQIPLSHTDDSSISSQIGLLQPFLQARKETPYKLYDDDALPESGTDVAQQAKKTLAGRPDVPPGTGRVILTKRKREPAPTAAQTANVTVPGVGTTSSSNGAAVAQKSAGGQTGAGGVQKKAKLPTAAS